MNRRLSFRWSGYFLQSAMLTIALCSPWDTTLAATSPAEPAENATAETSPQPGIVTLSMNNGQSTDLEMIQWPDGAFAIPVKAITALFGIEAQQPNGDSRMLFVDSVTGKQVELDWKAQTLSVDGQPVPLAHPIIYSERGLVNQRDAYLDSAVLGPLLNANFSYDEDATILSMTTLRKLNAPQATASLLLPDESNVQLISQPNVYRAVIEKVYVRNTGNYLRQSSGAGNAGAFRNTAMNSMMDSSTLGVSGTLFGQEYYFKPTFTHFNGRVNSQSIDWSVQHAFKNSRLNLGSSDAGLSTLSSPSLNVWGLKFASQNATDPTLTPPQAYDFSGQAKNGNAIQARINGRTVQSTTAQNDGYELESVYLQPQAINHLQIVEVDNQKRETVLVDRKIANYSGLLPKGKTAYSAFAGRAPLLFFPPLPDRKTPWLMPQSDKWLAGGRVFYGLGDRVTIGASVVADKIYGQPRTYYRALDPFSIDLTGINSYVRDSNFFSGQNASVSMRYQMTDHWLLAGDAGVSRMNVLPGSRLPLSPNSADTAAQLHLERQGARMTWFMDAFRYGSNYYTPSVMLYGNNLYDRRGFSTGVNGTLSRLLRLNYSLKWNRYQTNFLDLVPGGVITANQWNAALNSHINDRNDLILSLNWVDGKNDARNFDQRALDFTWRTQSLPWRLMGEVRASHYYTNTIFFPGKSSGLELSQSDYTNNALDLSLSYPLNQNRSSYIRVGNRISSFVDYGFVQAAFKIRRFTFEPLVQVSYGDRPQVQNRFGLRLGYQLPSGASISVGFYRNFSTFALANTLGGTQHSKINTNQFAFDFSDILSLFGQKVKSLGPNSESSGMVVGTVFADYQANGKPDHAEPGIRHAKLLLDKQTLVQTDNRGHYTLAGLSNGYHTLELLPESLPLTLGADNPVYKIKVSAGKTQRLDLPLSPQGGTVSGQIRLTNIRNETLPIEGVILVLSDTHGKVLNYTTPNSAGNYQFDNISAGRYQIDLEPKLKASGRYRIVEAPSAVSIELPKSYEESVEVNQQNLKLLAL
jgi:hypothetical protein